MSTVETQQGAYDLSFDGLRYSSGLWSLAGAEDSRVGELRRLVGDAVVEKVLKIDARPMLLWAVDLLDKGEPKDGAETWIWGQWGFYLTRDTIESKLAAVLRFAPGYRGHLNSGAHEDAVIRTLWCGFREDKLSAVVHVLPRDEQLRAGVREAAEMGTLEREYRLSLAPRELTFDGKDSMRIVGFGDAQQQKEMSLDLVRYTGTKGARIKSPIMLSAEQNADTAGQGGRTMELKFSTLEEMRNSDVVKLVVESEVTKRLSALTADEQSKVLSAVPVETLLKHSAVAPYAGRPTREEVLGSLTADEIKAALSRDELREAAFDVLEKTSEKMTQVKEKSLEQLQAMGLSAEDAARCFLLKGGEIAAAADPVAATKGVGELWLSAMTGGVPSGDARGGSTKGDAPAAPAQRPGVDEARQRLLRQTRGW